MATPVVFKLGTRAQYDALQTKNENALYFLTDTGEIYRGEQGLAQSSYYEDIKTVENAEEDVISNYLTNNKKIAVKGDIFVVKTLVADGVYSNSAYTYDGNEWQPISSTVLADNHSVELSEGLLTLKDFGKRFYKHIAETGSEAEGNLVPAHYELVEVSEADPWEAGLEPKVVLENGQLVIGWYQPNPTTAEGVQDQVTAVQGTVTDIKNTVTEVKEDLTTTQNEVKALDEEVDSIYSALYGSGEGETAVPGLIAEVEAIEQDLDDNYYTKTEIDGKVAGVFHFKGTADSFETLPSENNVAGDVYQVGEREYAWNGTEWVELGFVVDLSKHATIEYVDAEVKEVADNLASLDAVVNTEETGLVAVVGDLGTRVGTLESVGAEKNVLVGISVNGNELTPVEETRIVELPIFEGVDAGLVPVVPETVTDKANSFLNANGDWAVINVGDLGEHATIVDYVNAKIGDLGEHANVKAYVDAKAAEATPTWDTI